MTFGSIRRTSYPYVEVENDIKLEAKVFALEQKMESLLITTEALWELLQSKTNVTEDELVQKINEIDLRDGRLDNHKAKSEPRTCPKCHRVIKKGASICAYCNTVSPAKPFER